MALEAGTVLGAFEDHKAGCDFDNGRSTVCTCGDAAQAAGGPTIVVPATPEHHRARMADRLELIGNDLAALSHYWTLHDLPGDFLSGEAYPFPVELDELTARVRTAVDHIRGA
jgi:hypothetical protein